MRDLKKTAVVLSVVLMLSMVPVMPPAKAAGPADDAYIRVNKQTTTAYEEGGSILWSASGDKTAISGLSYNPKKNTLTIKNYNQPSKSIVLWKMGANFKIAVKGKKNSVQMIMGFSKSKGPCSISFTGSGTITVNNNKKADSGVYLNVIGKNESKVSFAKKTKARIYGKREMYPDTPICVYHTGLGKKGIAYSGKATGPIKYFYNKRTERYIWYVASTSFIKK